MADLSAAAPDLTRSAVAVHDAAAVMVGAGADSAAKAVRGAAAPYGYRYAPRILDAAKATKPRDRKGGDVVEARMVVGGRRQAFRGGASVTALVMGAEFGAKSGDVVRARTSAGGSRTVDAARFRSYRARAESQHVTSYTTRSGQVRRRAVKAGTAGAERVQVVAVRKGGLSQFPPRRRDGWVITPAVEDQAGPLWSDTDAAFIRALDRG